MIIFNIPSEELEGAVFICIMEMSFILTILRIPRRIQIGVSHKMSSRRRLFANEPVNIMRHLTGGRLSDTLLEQMSIKQIIIIYIRRHGNLYKMLLIFSYVKMPTSSEILFCNQHLQMLS